MYPWARNCQSTASRPFCYPAIDEYSSLSFDFVFFHFLTFDELEQRRQCSISIRNGYTGFDFQSFK